MNKPLYISTLLLLLAVNALASNKDVFRAQIVDSSNGEPVEFACVSNLSHTIGFMADADGRFSLTVNELPTDSIVISRIGYESQAFPSTDIPALIRLQQSPTTLQSVTVVPKKKKKLGSMFIPNGAQKAAFDIVSKVDFTHQHNHRFDSEIGRKFKFKQDTRINKIRVCLNRNDSVCVIFNVYRKVDDEWVNIHDRPIAVPVAASTDWRNIVEVDVTQVLEPQPKGEYLIGITKQGDGDINLWARQPVFEDGRQRVIGSDKWKKIDPVPGIEIEIEY